MFLISTLAEEILRRSGGRLTSRMLGRAETVSVVSFAPLSHARPEHVAFLAQSKYRDAAKASNAGALVLTQADYDAMYGTEEAQRAVIITSNPYAWFAWALQIMTARVQPSTGVDPRACVHPEAKVAASAVVDPCAVIAKGAVIGERTHVCSGAYVGEHVQVGEDTIIYPNAVIYHGCKVGDRVILHSGCVIGADGFGFAPFAGEWVKIPQVGAVTIGDDVEVGANTTIDRGALEDTVIGKGTKLDNQIQIGHNGKIGEHTVMAACTGVAGSTSIGSHVMVGGAANINGHISIPDASIVGPASTITHWDDRCKQMMGFFPAQDRRTFEKTAVLLKHLSEMRKTIKALQSEMETLKSTK